MELKEETVKKILQYLQTTQIWVNVEGLIHEISDQIQQQEKNHNKTIK